MTTEILEREREIDRHLPETRRAPTAALRAALEAWAATIWDAAAAAGASTLAPPTIERGVAVARRPVFVCGAHRSGTTLLRDLLDHHLALSVLPTEGMFFTSLDAKLRGRSLQSGLELMGLEWLRRLATSINQPPFWLLGRSSDQGSPYVTFARDLAAWWTALAGRLTASSPSWPLAAVALAYASDAGELPASLQQWVDKTPTAEQYLDRIWAEYPDARVIHMVRDPVAVFASRLQLEAQWRGHFRHAHRILQDLARSQKTAVARLASEPPARYRVIRYEDLLRDPRTTMEGLAMFLDVAFLPLLLTPSVAGLPASTNSSFGVRGGPGTIVPPAAAAARQLPARQRDLVAATVGEAARALGYPMPPVKRWRGRLLRLATQLR